MERLQHESRLPWLTAPESAYNGGRTYKTGMQNTTMLLKRPKQVCLLNITLNIHYTYIHYTYYHNYSIFYACYLHYTYIHLVS